MKDYKQINIVVSPVHSNVNHFLERVIREEEFKVYNRETDDMLSNFTYVDFIVQQNLFSTKEKVLIDGTGVFEYLDELQNKYNEEDKIQFIFLDDDLFNEFQPKKFEEKDLIHAWNIISLRPHFREEDNLHKQRRDIWYNYMRDNITSPVEIDYS